MCWSCGWTTLCVLRVGLDPLPAPHQAWLGARLAWHFHQPSWNCYCCLFMACARVWVGARGCSQLKDGSKLFPRAVLLVQQHVLTSFPKYVGFPSFPTQPFPSPLSFHLCFYGFTWANFLPWFSGFLLSVWGGQRVARPAEQVLQPPPALVNKFITSPIPQPRGFRQAGRFIILLTLHSS